jgi:3-keto-5-aminohexanoate cleavage enzyme
MSASYVWNYSDPYEYMTRVAKHEWTPLIITVAISGAGGKEVNPNFPEQPDEQAQHTYEAYKAGASIVHVHARDTTGAEATADPTRYREINRKIRQLCPDIIIANSTGIGPDVTLDEALRALDADPEMCSLNMGSFCVRLFQRARKPPLTGRDKDVLREWIFPYTFSFHEKAARLCLEWNIKPELEIYNPSMFEAIQNLIRQDLLKKPYWSQLIIAPMQGGIATPKQAISMIESLPPGSMYSIIAVGPFQLPLTTLSILLGGHLRVGLEDNLYYKKGELAKSNAQLVERAVRIAKELGREIATPSQTRQMLGLPATPKNWD